MQEAQDNQDMPNLEEIKNEDNIEESESTD
jgi:hypothetical protein